MVSLENYELRITNYEFLDIRFQIFIFHSQPNKVLVS